MLIKKRIALVVGAATLLVIAAPGSGSDQVGAQKSASQADDSDAVNSSTTASVVPASGGGSRQSPWDSTIGNRDGGDPGVPNNDRNEVGKNENKNEQSAGGKRTESRYGPATDSLIARTAHTSGKHVALTFDDGPHPAWTPKVLDLLRQHNAKATFCVVGQQVVAHPELVRRIVAEGHTLCDHTMTHDATLPNNTRAVQFAEIDGAMKVINQVAPGAPVPYYRAPEGTFSSEIQKLAASMGMRSVAWSIDTLDWTLPGTPAIVAAVQGSIGMDDVVLMHDGGGNRAQTVRALEQLLPWLVAHGYQFEFPTGPA